MSGLRCGSSLVAFRRQRRSRGGDRVRPTHPGRLRHVSELLASLVVAARAVDAPRVHPILAATTVASSPAVPHFVGAEKPWLATCPSTPAVGLYRRYLRATPAG